MYPIQEQFKSGALAQLNSRVLEAGRIAGNLLEISHDIGVLNMRTGKASAEALASAVQKLLTSSNPVEFFQHAAAVMRPDMQAWSEYAEQLRGITGKMAAPVLPASVVAAAEPLDLQGVVPPAAVEAAVQEPPLPVEALMPAETEAPAAPAPVIAAPEVPQEVVDTVKSVAKSAPVLPAAAASGPETLAKAAIVPKAAVKAGRVQAAQKASASAKSLGRARKG